MKKLRILEDWANSLSSGENESILPDGMLDIDTKAVGKLCEIINDAKVMIGRKSSLEDILEKYNCDPSINQRKTIDDLDVIFYLDGREDAPNMTIELKPVDTNTAFIIANNTIFNKITNGDIRKNSIEEQTLRYTVLYLKLKIPAFPPFTYFIDATSIGEARYDFTQMLNGIVAPDLYASCKKIKRDNGLNIFTSDGISEYLYRDVKSFVRIMALDLGYFNIDKYEILDNIEKTKQIDFYTDDLERYKKLYNERMRNILSEYNIKYYGQDNIFL